MKRYTFLAVSLLVLASMFIQPAITQAAPPDKEISKLFIGDKVKFGNSVVGEYLGKDENGKYKFKSTISAPIYLDNGNEVKIQWTFANGVYSTKDNLFSATVTGTSVDTAFKGSSMSWNPTISVGGVNIPPNTNQAVIQIYDPINANNIGNVLQWQYGNDIVRRVRQIEGVLSDSFIVSKKPAGDIVINENKTVIGKNYDRPVFAFDADNKNIPITSIGDIKTVKLVDLDNVKYPVTIDPSPTYYTSASDGYLIGSAIQMPPTSWANLWDSVHDQTTGSVYSSGAEGGVGVDFTYSSTPYYYGYTYRQAIYFDTSGLPDTAIISASTLSIYGTVPVWTNFGAWTMVVQGGMPTYPHDPLVAADNLFSYYSGSYGNITSANMGSGYKAITLNASGLSAIDVDGTTKFMLREKEHDIDDVLPAPQPGIGTWKENFWYFYQYEQGVGYRPKLDITYTIPAPTISTVAATDITTSSARLQGYITNDGGEANTVRWGFATASHAADFTAYSNITSWSAYIYATGDHPYNDLAGLLPSTTYYYNIQAANTGNNVTATEMSFTTTNGVSAPTNFMGLPTSDKISLSWTKGVGAANTRIYYLEGSIPSSNVTGTLLYSSIGTTTELASLLPGKTYGFRAYGYSAGAWSTDSVTELMTTTPSIAATTVGTPTQPSGWLDTPSSVKLDGTIGGAILNPVATSLEIPTGTFWFVLFMLLASLLAFGVWHMSRSFVFAITGMCILMLVGWKLGLVPFMIFVLSIGVTGISWIIRERA